MPQCKMCGGEIFTDETKVCGGCKPFHDADRAERNRKARKRRQEREQALRDLGLIKVRGAHGGTYWE